MIVSFTGHRPDKLNNEWDMKGPLSTKIYNRLNADVEMLKPEKIIVGMALGVDIIAANVAIRKGIPFIAAVPCYRQEKNWPDNQQKLYSRIINDPLCTYVCVTESEYTPSVMQDRNEWMVDNSDLLIAVWDGSPGGTKNCYMYAKTIGRRIHRINPKDL